jgi:hypothetical protein
VKTCLLLLLVCLLAPVALGGSSAKSITAVRTDRRPVLDGMVTEDVWKTASPILDFTQFDPSEGQLPTEQTSVRVLFDDHALYVGVICYDGHPDGIVTQLTRRDRSSEAERFTVMIDSYHDHQTAFVFSSNVAGVQSDGMLSQDGAVYDITLDMVWNVVTATYLDGWSAEFEIPFNALRFSEQKSADLEWGVNFRRYISRKNETDEWVMVPRSERLQISRWGHLRGLANILPPLHLNIAPYLSGSSTFHPANSSWSRKSDQQILGGLDIKYGVTRDFTLDASVNPDFGQVEVDQAVLNLTVFETEYPEKRPFFVEGAQMFAFGAGVDNTSMPLFFSRRIGKSPSLSGFVASPAGGSIEENPPVTTIWGAAKLSGHTADGFSIGALSAATSEENALVRDLLNNTTSIRTEPRGLYNVVRVKQEFGGRSWIGAIGTVTARDQLTPSLSGGLDWNLRFDDGAYTIDGYAAGTRGSSGAQDKGGTAGRLLFSRIAAEHWFYTTAYDFASRSFNPNDIGFFARPHDHGGYAQLLYRENFAPGIFRRYSGAINPEYRWNWDGVLTHAVVNAELSGEFTNFWTGSLQYSYAHPAFDDAERGIIGTYRRPVKHSITSTVGTDAREDVSLTLNATVDIGNDRMRGFLGWTKWTLRPASWCELSPIILFGRIRQEQAWVFRGGNIVDPAIGLSPFSVFGSRDVDQLDLELRGIVTFTRDLSLQFFSQVFLARGKYSEYKRLLPTSDLTPYAPQPDFAGADFNLVMFNANVLLRWEYLPGSTLYLVWTQERADDSGLYTSGFNRRFSDAFTLPHQDVLLLKVSYWLPL